MRDVAVQLDRARGTGRSATSRPPLAQQRSPLASGVVAGIWAAILGLVLVAIPVVVAWFLSPQPGVTLSGAVRTAVLGWLLANHATLLTSIGPVTLAPLGLTLVVGFVAYRAGRRTAAGAVRVVPAAAGSTAALAVGYTGVAVIVTALVNGHTGSVSMRSVVVGAFGVSAIAGGLGVLSGAGVWAHLAGRLPVAVIEIARSAAAGLAILVGGGAAIVGLSLLGHLGTVASLSRALGGGAVGGILLILLGLAAVPTAAVWAASYAVGPGFAVGVGTSVAPAGIVLGAVPAFPMLGALPAAGPAPLISLLAFCVPIGAGTVIGWFAAHRPADSAMRTGAEACAAGILAGVGLGLLALLSTGGFGDGRLAALGPVALRTGWMASLEVGAIAALVAWGLDRHGEALDRGWAWVAGLPGRLRVLLGHGRGTGNG
jgi:Family of unknown function (DUF6350)